MDDLHRELTADERRAFREIEDGLRRELDPAPIRLDAAALGWASVAVAGSLLGLIGLIGETLAVSFAGYVVALAGLDRFSLTSTATRWRRHVEVRFGLRPRDGRSDP